MNEYEALRERRMRENAALLFDMDIPQLTQDVKIPIKKTTKFKTKKLASSPQPLRRSLRINQSIATPLKNGDEKSEDSPMSSSNTNTRVFYSLASPADAKFRMLNETSADRRGVDRPPLTDKNVLDLSIPEEDIPKLDSFKNVFQETFSQNENLFSSWDSNAASEFKMKFDMIKIVPRRIYSLKFHPDAALLSKPVFAVGDRDGYLSLSAVDLQDGSDTSCLLRPHRSPINQLFFDKFDKTKLFSCAYDGCVRVIDAVTGDVTEPYRNEAVQWIRGQFVGVSGIASTSSSGGKLLYLSLYDGSVVLCDMRQSPIETNEVSLSNRGLRSISLHPINDHLLLTGDQKGKLCLWDVRNFSFSTAATPLWSVERARAINSAYFSPLTGCQLLVTPLDNEICIYEQTNLNSASMGYDLKRNISHYNNTGRWLTRFKAVWLPKNDKFFSIGSLSRPRRIELFHTDKESPCHNFMNELYLNSVCSILDFDENLQFLIGGNSSGRVAFFTRS